MADNEQIIVIKAEDQASGTFQKVGSEVEKMGQKAQKAFADSSKSANENTQANGGAKSSFLSLAGSVATGQAIFAGVTKAWQLMKDAIAEASAYESTRVALDGIMGSAEKAGVMMQQLEMFGDKFAMAGAQQAGMQLMAFGVKAENVIGTMYILGNAAASTGNSLGNMVEIYGRMQSMGEVSTRTLMQLTMAHIPIIQQLADKYGVTKDKINDMVRDGKIGLKDVNQAMTDLYGSSGKFHQAMEKQAGTFAGLVFSMKDRIEDFGRSLLGVNDKGDILKNGLFATIKDALSFGLKLWDEYGGTVTKVISTVIGAVVQFGQMVGKIFVNIVLPVLKFALDGWKQFFKAIGMEQFTFGEFIAKAWNALVSFIGEKIRALISSVRGLVTEFNKVSPLQIDTNPLLQAELTVIRATGSMKMQVEEYGSSSTEIVGQLGDLWSGFGNDVQQSAGKQSGATKDAGKAMEDLGKKYTDAREKIKGALDDLGVKHNEKMAKIEESVKKVKQQITELDQSYRDLVNGGVKDYGTEVVNAQQKLADLQSQLSSEKASDNPDSAKVGDLTSKIEAQKLSIKQASDWMLQSKEQETQKIAEMENRLANLRNSLTAQTDLNKRASLNAQIQDLAGNIEFQKLYLADFSNMQMSLATSVASAKSLAGKSELDQFIIGWQSKMVKENLEYLAKKKKLEDELKDLGIQKTAEEKLYTDTKKHIMSVQNEVYYNHLRLMQATTQATAIEINKQIALYQALAQSAANSVASAQRSSGTTAQRKAEGGFIERMAYGGFVPSGTDTVPAMLTPGELILNMAQQKNLANGIGGRGDIVITGNNFYGDDRTFADRIANTIMQTLKGATSIPSF